MAKIISMIHIVFDIITIIITVVVVDTDYDDVRGKNRINILKIDNSKKHGLVSTR